MSTEPEHCDYIDSRDGLIPGTSAIRLIAGDVRYRQQSPGSSPGTACWIAEPLDAVTTTSFGSNGHIETNLRGVGPTPDAAMAQLWDNAVQADRVNVHRGRRLGNAQFTVAWDPARGWIDPDRAKPPET